MAADRDVMNGSDTPDVSTVADPRIGKNTMRCDTIASL